jgi:hypothetical protein
METAAAAAPDASMNRRRETAALGPCCVGFELFMGGREGLFVMQRRDDRGHLSSLM